TSNISGESVSLGVDSCKMTQRRVISARSGHFNCKGQLLPMAASDQFKSFIGHLDNARNDTVQTMKILQTFWALAQNEGARLVSAEQRLNSCAAASEEMLGQTDALVNRLLENGLFEFNLPPALWVDPNSQQYQDTYNDLATQYRAADGKLEQNGRSVEGRLKTCRKDITTEQQKLQTTLHESYARLQNLLAHQYAYEELLGNYRQYKTVKDDNQREFCHLKSRRQDRDSLRDSLKTRPSLQVLSCAAASEEMLGQTDALVNRLLENGLFEFNLPPALWVDPNSQQYQDTYNDLATQYRAADGKLEQNSRSVEGRLKTCRKDITTEQQKLQTTLHESYARLQGLLIHQYAYEELLGNYRQYKTVKDANQRLCLGSDRNDAKRYDGPTDHTDRTMRAKQ
ncbi:hypothetical protein PROFUN_17013, partial [Planoprotostelium fungivorum]